MSQTESRVRRRKSYDDLGLCDLQFVLYEVSRFFFKALTDSAITVFCDKLFHGDTLTVKVFMAIHCLCLCTFFECLLVIESSSAIVSSSFIFTSERPCMILYIWMYMIVYLLFHFFVQV